MGRRDLMKLLKKINNKNLVKCEKNRTFSNDEEPTALATDVGKPIPILSGEASSCFLRNMKKVEEEAERRRNIPPTIEQLEKQLMYEEFFLEDDLRGIEERKERISNLRNKIKFLKEKNGKTEER